MTPTSKFDLKMQCLAIANGNVDEAMKLYAFVADDLQIPDIAVSPPTTLQQVKSIAGNVFGWVKENKEDILGMYDFVQSFRKSNQIQVQPNIPPLQ